MKLIIEELHAAAFFFSKHPESTAADVGAFVGKSPRTIERWSQTAEWNTALDNLGFKGDRNWRRTIQRDIQRESGDLVDEAKKTYEQLLADGTPRHQLITETARQLDLPIPRIRNRVKRFHWTHGEDDGKNLRKVTEKHGQNHVPTK